MYILPCNKISPEDETSGQAFSNETSVTLIGADVRIDQFRHRLFENGFEEFLEMFHSARDAFVTAVRRFLFARWNQRDRVRRPGVRNAFRGGFWKIARSIARSIIIIILFTFIFAISAGR